MNKLSKILNFVGTTLGANPNTLTTNAKTIVGAINELKTTAVKMSDIYPVGSIYMSVNNVDPGTLFGGTWVAWGGGRVPVGVGTSDRTFAANESGGSSNAVVVSHTHPFSLQAIQGGDHSHSVRGWTNSNGSHEHNMGGDIWSAGSGGGKPAYTMDTNRTVTQRYTVAAGDHRHYFDGNTDNFGTHSHPVGGSINSSGVAGTNKNLQPYITCYMWKRTA